MKRDITRPVTDGDVLHVLNHLKKIEDEKIKRSAEMVEIGTSKKTFEIWKYPLEIVAEQVIQIPLGETVLSVKIQKDKLCLWASVRPSAVKVKRSIIIVGTGIPIPERTINSVKFIGTVLTDDDSLVWHVFIEAITVMQGSEM